jgi:hypothetical protein
MRLRRAASTVAVVAALVAPAVAADRSGPKAGDHATPFDVNDITGKNKGKSLCYV